MSRFLFALLLSLTLCLPAHADIFGRIQGIVHDPQHRPIAGAHVELRAAHSAYSQLTTTGPDGAFAFSSIPIGDYRIQVLEPGFATETQPFTLASGTTPVLHFELAIATGTDSVTVQTQPSDPDTATPITLISREEIALTPGADRTNSMAMITSFVPGAYMTHDMLHMRGGHQLSWLIDGVQIPNTNISSNVGAQIDPKDIDYLEVQRGALDSSLGDRTDGAFNVLPRTGFERDHQAELVLSAGSFNQTNDQLNLGDHTQRFAWYTSVTGNRSDYGLASPTAQTLHDTASGLGAFASLMYNRTPKDQFRNVSQLRRDSFEIPFDPDPSSFENAQFDSSGLRDTQHEVDALEAATWLHTFNPSTVLQLSPFVHYNRANYDSPATDTPVATTSHRASLYSGAQASITASLARNTLQAGLYGFGQHDQTLFAAISNNGTGTPPFSLSGTLTGGLVEAYVSDNLKLTQWLTVIAGLRQTHFVGDFTENATAPRLGATVRVPRLGWVFRGFYGRTYQPPPLLTATGPLVQFAQASNTTFQPLHGERDEEHQFGVQIPLKGWLLDADTFRTRARNFLDHSNIGDSSIYFPVTLDGALIRAWELTLSTPRSWKRVHGHLAYSNQVAQQRGAVTGGLVCAPIGSPQCTAGFTYTPLDHDQRNTLSAGLSSTLPGKILASLDLSYGSGFKNGNPDPTTPYPNPYLEPHTTFDLSLGHTFREDLTTSVSITNLTNRRLLLDNSLTFGGFHYNEPRQLFAELKYRFKYRH